MWFLTTDDAVLEPCLNPHTHGARFHKGVTVSTGYSFSSFRNILFKIDITSLHSTYNLPMRSLGTMNFNEKDLQL